MNSDFSMVRRDVIKAAGAGLATSLLTGAAQAQTPAQGGAEFWTAEYTAKKGDVSLVVYRKRLGAPTAGEPAKPVLFLVHGSSNAALSSYDLHVPGKAEYSMMNVFARLRYDVWTMDHEGYGKSSRTSGNSDIASGVEDLARRRHSSRGKPDAINSTSTAPPRAEFAPRRSPKRSRGGSTGWCSPPSPTRAKTRRRCSSGRSNLSTTRPTTLGCATAP